MNEFEIGDNVSFTFEGKTQIGTIIDSGSNGLFKVSFAIGESGLSLTMSIHYTKLTKI